MGRPRRVLVVCGPSGTDKSHFIEALGHHAIDRGRTVAWHTLETLAALFRRHRVDDSIHKATRSGPPLGNLPDRPTVEEVERTWPKARRTRSPTWDSPG